MAGIQNLEEFTKELTGVVGNHQSTTTLPWFRGQRDFDWGLQPGIFRNGGTSDKERELCRDFYLNAVTKLKRMPENNFELLFIMQHYGIPTRLLDWTEGSLFALYFAVCNIEEKGKEKDSAVWILHPWDLNQATLPNISGFGKPFKTVPNSNNHLIQEYTIDYNLTDQKINHEFPIAIRPVRTSDRISAQKGMFTIHGSNSKNLDQIIEDFRKSGNKIDLHKIRIDGGHKRRILKELYHSGISHALLFPELEGIAREIAFRYSQEFTGSKDTHHFNGF